MFIENWKNFVLIILIPEILKISKKNKYYLIFIRGQTTLNFKYIINFSPYARPVGVTIVSCALCIISYATIFSAKNVSAYQPLSTLEFVKRREK